MQKYQGKSEGLKKSLLEQLQEQGVYIPADCGGIGRCGKCRVQFLSGVPEATEADYSVFSPGQIAAGWRLACKVHLTGEYEIAWEQTEDEIVAEAGFSGIHLVSPGKKEASAADSARAGGDPNLVAAVDIGTTTLAVSLVDRVARKVLETKTSVNHQRAFGADVISRIQASVDGKGEELQTSIRKDLMRLMSDLGADFSKTPLIISGNTTMEHLLLGLPCDTLGVAPYTPVDISMHQEENMLILPGISTYVGADIVSGIIACGMDQSEEVSLLIDLGTNGEMAIGNKDRILVASTAAGPAFEGGNIHCGVAGIPGAVSAVMIRPENSSSGETDIDAGRQEIPEAGLCVHYETIGDKAPVGLCGTGVLEVMYELLKAEIVDETGMMDEDYEDDGFPIAENVVFTDQDVREVQLAKSAIRAGAETLMQEYGISCEEVAHLYLAGGFGQKINLEKAAGIGLLPEELIEKTKAVGNSSLAGAVMLAKDDSLRQRFVRVAEQTGEVSLTGNPTFSELYMEYMMFDA